MTTEPVSPNFSERLSKNGASNETTILQALARTSQVRVAEILGTSEASISRLKDNSKGRSEIGRIAEILAALDLQVINTGSMIIDPNDLSALERFALNYLKIKVEGRA